MEVPRKYPFYGETTYRSDFRPYRIVILQRPNNQYPPKTERYNESKFNYDLTPKQLYRENDNPYNQDNNYDQNLYRQPKEYDEKPNYVYQQPRQANNYLYHKQTYYDRYEYPDNGYCSGNNYEIPMRNYNEKPSYNNNSTYGRPPISYVNNYDKTYHDSTALDFCDNYEKPIRNYNDNCIRPRPNQQYKECFGNNDKPKAENQFKRREGRVNTLYYQPNKIVVNK